MQLTLSDMWRVSLFGLLLCAIACTAPSPTVTLSPSPPPTESPSPLSPQSTIPLPPLPPSTPSPQPPSTSPPPSTPSPQPPSPSPSLLRHPSDVPSNVRTTEVTSSDITILWHPMDFITGYSLWYGVHGSGSSQIVYIQGAATTETTISGLNSTTNYSIKVAAVNNAGIGNYSDPIIATTKGQIEISGHETPLIVGLARDIMCTWVGEGNATKMQWFLVGLVGLPIQTVMDSNSLILAPDLTTDGLNGAMFICKVTTASGKTDERTITLRVKEFENTINITTSDYTPTAGRNLTITCTVISDLPAELKWLKPNGEQVVSGEGIVVSPQVSNGSIDTIKVIYNPLRSSHSGICTCISLVEGINPPSRKEMSHLLTVSIPSPSIYLTRVPDHPTQLFTTNSLVLTCIIEISDAVDTPVAINTTWSGHSSLFDNRRRVIVSDLEGLKLMYETFVAFSSLKSQDSGTYECLAKIRPQISGSVIDSPWSFESINIRVSLNVTIKVNYNPPLDFTHPSPPYYRPATSVTLTCQVYGGTGSIRYRWSSTGSGSFASSSTAQSVSKNIITSSDSGIHTCTATDDDGNTGSNNTEMQLIGAGIYVVSSRYLNNIHVANNSMISLKTESYYYYITKFSFYCYSNSSTSSVGYLRYPNGNAYYSNQQYYVYVNRVSPSGIKAYCSNRNNYNPNYYGIYTCELPDAEGNTIFTAIGIYSSNSLPTLNIGYCTYTDMTLRKTDIALLGTVVCQTSNSPPTNVTWLRDGIPIHMGGEKYELVQTVTDVSNSYYTTTLLIKSAVHLAGKHTYSFLVRNYAGNTSQRISTHMNAKPVLSIKNVKEPIYTQQFTLTCRATLNPKIASQLIQYMILEWIGPNGETLTNDSNITVGHQKTFYNESVQILTFDSLKMTHGGLYTCRAIIVFPDSGIQFNSSSEYHLSVLNKTIIQLKFGPMSHCSKWFNKRIATHLEQDINRTIRDVIKKACNLQCSLESSLIADGEYSCQTSSSCVIFRAHLIGSSNTLNISQLLTPIQNWLYNDGTFIYTYHGRIRVRADPKCPLEVSSFSDPECGGDECLRIQSNFTTHAVFDEL